MSSIVYSMDKAFNSVKHFDGHLAMISGVDIEFEDVDSSDASGFKTVNGSRRSWDEVGFICVTPSILEDRHGI